MLYFKKRSIALSLAVLATIFTGCGSEDSSSFTETPTVSGQLVDSYVSGAHYKCGEDTEGTTAQNGEFSCEKLPISFSLGTIQLGEITTMPQDGHIFPQDLLGVDRADTNNTQVVAMAQLLQSLDSDHNPENGIEIDTPTLERFTIREQFSMYNLDAYLAEAQVAKVTALDAHAHLEQTTRTVASIANAELPQDIKDSLNSPLSTLSDAVKDDIIYMENEERLAYDIYNALFALYPEQKQLENIPQKSEIKHIAAVDALATKYSLDINSSVTAGVYSVEAVQNLYDLLLAKGQNSAVEALEVGCMVEVTDIDDLNRDIIDAEESNASDVVDTFNFLRDGSYSHYWAFDNGLKNLGVESGCCSLGDEYCKTEEEYPKNERGRR